MAFHTLSNRWLRPEVVRFVAGVSLGMVVVLAILQFATARRGQTGFGTPLGADYAEFHAVGRLMNAGSGDRLYDLGLQDEWLHRTLPLLPETEHLPFFYPPFVAAVFRPLAMLPFEWSCAAWLILTLGLYAASVALILRADAGSTRSDRATTWLVALSFEPFAMECWLGGQLSALGCLAVAAALAFEQRGRPLLVGIALAGLLYKPTLALVIAPLLVFGRRWRTIGGFAIGAVVLAMASWLVAGAGGCREFAGLMVGYGRRGGSVAEGLKRIKYVDLRAFLDLLGVDGRFVVPMAVAIGLPAMVGLAVAWSRAARRPAVDLAWAAALCWTPILNVYGPIYDASIVVPGLLLADRALRRRGRPGSSSTFRRLLAVVYLAGLFSPAMAQALGLQPLTIALAATGTFLLAESLRAGVGDAEEISPGVDDHGPGGASAPVDGRSPPSGPGPA